MRLNFCLLTLLEKAKETKCVQSTHIFHFLKFFTLKCIGCAVSLINALSNTEKLSLSKKNNQQKLVVPKMRNPNCKNIKCPPVEDEICVKVKLSSPTAGSKVIHIVMLNKCEIEYANCNQDMEAKIVPMKYCGDHNLLEDNISAAHNRSKRSASIGELGKQNMQLTKKTIKTNSKPPKTLQNTKILKKISRQRMTSREGFINNNRLLESDSEIKLVTDTESEGAPKKPLLNGDSDKDSDLKKFIFSDGQRNHSDLKQARDATMLNGNMFKEPMFKTSVFSPERPQLSSGSAEMDTTDHKVKTTGSDKSSDYKSDVTSIDKKASGRDVAFTSDDDAKVTSSEVTDGDKKTSGSDVALTSDNNAKLTSGEITDGDTTSSGSKVANTSDDDAKLTSNEVTDDDNTATGSAKFTSSEVTDADGDNKVTNKRDYINSNHAIDKDRPEINANVAVSSGSEENTAGSNSDGLLKESSGKENNFFEEPMFALPMFRENQKRNKLKNDQTSSYETGSGDDETSYYEEDESSDNDQAASDENPDTAIASASGSESYYESDSEDPSTNEASGSSNVENRAHDSSRKETMSGSDSDYSSSGSRDHGSSNGSDGEWKKLAGHFEDDTNYDYPIKEEVVEQAEYTAKCPTVCPAQATMVCARCADRIYKTFMSVCHMRMFSCKHPEEKIELVARAPCVLSAPYLSGMPDPRGLVREPQDEDMILKYINCRERGC